MLPHLMPKAVEWLIGNDEAFIPESLKNPTPGRRKTAPGMESEDGWGEPFLSGGATNEALHRRRIHLQDGTADFFRG